MPVVAFPGMPGPDSPADDRATVASAVARFLDSLDAAITRRSYACTLARLTAASGTRHPVAALDCDHYATVMDHWAAAEPATWNRHLSALVSFTTWAQRQDLLATSTYPASATTSASARRPPPASPPHTTPRPDDARADARQDAYRRCVSGVLRPYPLQGIRTDEVGQFPVLLRTMGCSSVTYQHCKPRDQ
jgi:hypothetical protein